MNFKDFIVCIPARLGSTRLQNKPLINICGKPLISHVLSSVKKIKLDIPILVATDSKKIADVVKKEGELAILTRKDHQSGSDRIFEAINSFDPKKKIRKIIHLQGDLVNVSKSLLLSLSKIISKEKIIATPVVKASDDELEDPNVVKCAVSFKKMSPFTGDIGNALYFSRTKIPWGTNFVWHHLGIYGWDRSILEKFVSIEPSPLERFERLEQLRALEFGIKIKVFITRERPIGIDTKFDLDKFIKHLKNTRIE